MKTVKEIAAMFGVSQVAVRKWLKDGLPYQKQKIIGIKTRIIIDPQFVIEYQKNKEKM